MVPCEIPFGENRAMRLRSFGFAIAFGLAVGSLGGCSVGEVEEAWQRNHQSRSPDIAKWSAGLEAGFKDWFPGIRALPPGAAERLN